MKNWLFNNYQLIGYTQRYISNRLLHYRDIQGNIKAEPSLNKYVFTKIMNTLCTVFRTLAIK